MIETQNAQILAHLKAGRSITFLEALERFGCMHLPRRILDLKEAGHAINDQWEKAPNGKRYKRWWIDQEPGNV